MFWFNVFNISGHSSSKVLFPSLLKGKNIFLIFFLFDKYQIFITYIHFIAYVHLLKKEGDWRSQCCSYVCPLFFGFGTIYEFSQNFLWILCH